MLDQLPKTTNRFTALTNLVSMRDAVKQSRVTDSCVSGSSAQLMAYGHGGGLAAIKT
jgi:hypothetical protein